MTDELRFEISKDGKVKRHIFVFGSNLAGRHGKGAALEALHRYGAIYGLGSGPQGYSYAIPTKDQNLNTLPLEIIKLYVDQFLTYARKNPDETFKVTAIGCGLAGYSPQDVAPLFATYPMNCALPSEFLTILAEPYKLNKE